jgi:type I restriction enzyme S subunit
MVLLRPARSKVVDRYLLFALQSDSVQEQIRWSEGTGSTVSNLRIPHLKKLQVPRPSISEQRFIAEILGALDDKIELNCQMNRTLEAMARAIFKAWFVDFDPVQAKAAGRHSFPGMPQDVFEQLPDRFIDTELGLVPEGWTHVPIGDLVDVIGGGTPSTKNPDFWGSGKFPFCTPKDMSRLTSPVLLETERHITQAGVDKISSGQLPVGTVILSSLAPIGYLALAETPISVNQGIIAMITGEIPNTYVLLWTKANMEVIKSRAGGSTFAEISKRNFRPIPALRPDDCTLSAFGDVVQPLFELIASNERQDRVLAATRDMLLPKLISGELRIPAAERGTDGG